MGDTYVIDIEATGVYPTTANILQLTALKYSDTLSEWELRNWYFNPKKAVPFEVVNLTGLTTEYLREQSEGLCFEEQCDNAIDIFDPKNTLVGHNIIRYDSVVIKNNYSRAGVRMRSFPSMYDTMLEAKNLSFVHSGRWIKLGELYRMACDNAGLSPNQLMSTLTDIFEFNEHELQAHNAKYDVLMNALTYYLMRQDLQLGR